MADVEHTHPGADRHVLGNDPGVLYRHVPTVELDHLGAELTVNGVERGFADCGRGFDRRQEQASISRRGLGRRTANSEAYHAGNSAFNRYSAGKACTARMKIWC